MPGVDAPPMGVAEEFLLYGLSGTLASCGAEVVRAAGVIGLRAQPVLGRAQLALTSPLCGHPRELRRVVLAARMTTAAVARSADARLIAAGAQPAGELGEQPVCACRIRVRVPDRETGVRVLNHLRPWLPVLLALGANSAVHLGRDTGYASCRTILRSGRPCAGPPPYFTSAAHYDDLAAMQLDTGIHWDARLSAETVEVQLDVPATADETVVLATLVRALVAAALRHLARGEAAPLVPEQPLRLATWRAARDGLTGLGVEPHSGRLVPQTGLVADLLRHVRPELGRFGELRMTTRLVERTLAFGNGATHQRAAFTARGSAADVLAHLERLTVRDPSSCTTPTGLPESEVDDRPPRLTFRRGISSDR